MRTFFEYIFYRVYLQYDENDLPVFTGSVVTVTIFGCLFMFIWINVMEMCFQEMPKQIYWFSIPLVIISYVYFLRRKDRIVLRFEDSRWNKIVPNWAIWTLLPISFIVGLYMVFPIKDYIEAHHLQGCIGRWLSSLW